MPFPYHLLEERDHLEDDIKMDLKEIGWKGLDWYILGIEKAADSCEPGDESSSSINSEKFLD